MTARRAPLSPRQRTPPSHTDSGRNSSRDLDYCRRPLLAELTKLVIETLVISVYNSNMNQHELSLGLQHLSDLLQLEGDHAFSIVVCGVSALIACDLVQRTTKDVDILALMQGGKLSSPAPLPETLVITANRVAIDLGLPDDWLNNGPSSGPGGLFQVGLPDALEDRLTLKSYGTNLQVFYVGRLDQICFKLYAAVDQMGSYHGQDLAKLNPTLEELEFAITWVKTQDSSEGFLTMLEQYLMEVGHDDAVQFI